MLSEIPKETWCCNNNDSPEKFPKEGVKNGQYIVNMDNGDVWAFDKEANEWKKQ